MVVGISSQLAQRILANQGLISKIDCAGWQVQSNFILLAIKIKMNFSLSDKIQMTNYVFMK